MTFGLFSIPFCLILLSSTVVYGQMTDSKNVYRLKCFTSQHDCTIIKSNSLSNSNELESSNLNDNSESIEMPKRSFAKLHSLIKKYFSTSIDHPSAYKADLVNCVSSTLCTAKIEKKGNRGSSNLACVGDPYSGSGSRCLPLEGLYIGRK